MANQMVTYAQSATCPAPGNSHSVSTAEAQGERSRLDFRVRRIIDVFTSAVALLVLLPLIGVVAVMDVGLPILLRQLRPGRSMRPFALYKFRTMRIAYDDDGKYRGDGERTSAVGRLLRRTRLDDVPQFYKVLIGDMSLTGPRPLLRRICRSSLLNASSYDPA